MSTLTKRLIFTLFLIAVVPVPIAQAKTHSTSLCNNSKYICYQIKRGDSWDKLFNGNQRDIDLVKRINRINIKLYPGMKIGIPRNLDNAELLHFSPFDQQISPMGEKVIFVSLKQLAWGAYNPDGRLLRWGPVSGGKSWCPDVNRRCNTATGKFTIYRKGGAHCVSTRFPIPHGGAPMPYCMFFHGGFALHGSYEVPGYHASHGCVRMFIDDAKWLNQEFTAGGQKVVVYVSGY